MIDNIYNQLIVIIFFIFVGALLYYLLHKKIENFYQSEDSVEMNIIKLYSELLNREPSPKELIQNTRSINSGISLSLLKQKIIDSDEYERVIKTQNDSLTPELPKLISDRKLILFIGNIYTSVRKTPMPAKMSLPLKDLFILANYNIQILTTILSSPQYSAFETDVINANLLNRDRMLEIYRTYYDMFAFNNTENTPVIKKFSILDPSGDILNMDQARQALDQTSDSRKFYSPDSNDISLNLPTQLLNSSDSSSKDYINSLYNPGKEVTLPAKFLYSDNEFNKRNNKTNKDYEYCPYKTESPGIDGNGPINKNTIHTNDGSMVLRPEFAWSVPQYHPPVCTMDGPALKVSPILESSKNLNGTPLDEAKTHTAVGSIMPAFDYLKSK